MTRRLLILSTVLALATEVGAQQVVLRGTVVDAFSRVPVPSVTVHLISGDGQTGATTVTDTIGRYRFTAAPGEYRVRAMRLGYLGVESGSLRVDSVSSPVADLAMTRRVVLDSVLVLSAVSTTPLTPTQQLLHGRMLDDDTGEPIAGGVMELQVRTAGSLFRTIGLVAKNRTVATVTTDRNGLFRFVTPGPGKYTLVGKRLGYTPSQQNGLDVSLGDTLLLDFRLSRHAALMAPVHVTASAKPLGGRSDRARIHALNERMRRFGDKRYAQYILRDTIDAYDHRSYSTVEMLAWVIKRPAPGPPQCRGATYFLDGLPFFTPEGFGPPTEFYSLNLLELVEVYTHPTLPAEFATAELTPRLRSPAVPPCRVVSLWTRR